MYEIEIVLYITETYECSNVTENILACETYQLHMITTKYNLDLQV